MSGEGRIGMMGKLGWAVAATGFGRLCSDWRGRAVTETDRLKKLQNPR